MLAPLFFTLALQWPPIFLILETALCMRLIEQCLRTTVQQVTPRLPATMSQP